MQMSDRGFMYGNDIPTTYGGYIRAYESSSAEGPHIWVKVVDGDDMARAHLTLASATQLRDPAPRRADTVDR